MRGSTVNLSRRTNLNYIVYIIVSHDLHVNYYVNYVVEVSSYTEVYIAVNYHSLQSFIPWETR